MNREIKFRGQKLLSNEFVYGYLTSLNEIRVYVTDEWEGQYDTFLIDPNTIGQFTGRYDKNGTEIYEGDIFDFYGIVNVVIFKDGMFCYDSYRENKNLENIVGLNNYYFKWENNKSSEIEVIGTIYENPELLKN